MFYLLIDTNIFVKNKFYTASEQYKQLYKYSKENSVTILLNSILLGEYRSNLNNLINNTVKEFSIFINNKSLLGSMYRINHEKNNKEIKENFRTYLRNETYTPFFDFINSLNTIDFNVSVNVDDVFNKYFNYDLPFEDNKLKRKEFPDAFIVQSIIEFKSTINKDDILLIVSEDKGFIKSLSEKSSRETSKDTAIENLPFEDGMAGFSSLNNCLNYISKQLHSNNILIPKIMENDTIYENLQEVIQDDLDVLDLDSIDIYYSEDVEITEVSNALIETLDFEVINIDYDDDQNLLYCYITVSIISNIDTRYEYPDYGSAYYDSENNDYGYFRRISNSEEAFVPIEYSVVLQIPYKSINENDIEFVDDNIIIHEPVKRVTDPVIINLENIEDVY